MKSPSQSSMGFEPISKYANVPLQVDEVEGLSWSLRLRDARSTHDKLWHSWRIVLALNVGDVVPKVSQHVWIPNDCLHCTQAVVASVVV